MQSNVILTTRSESTRRGESAKVALSSRVTCSRATQRRTPRTWYRHVVCVVVHAIDVSEDAVERRLRMSTLRRLQLLRLLRLLIRVHLRWYRGRPIWRLSKTRGATSCEAHARRQYGRSCERSSNSRQDCDAPHRCRDYSGHSHIGCCICQ